MPAYLPYEASVRNAENFIINCRDNRNLYLGLAKSTVWGAPDTPPTINGVNQEKIDFWDNIITSIRRVDPKDVIGIVPKVQWVSATSYVAFDNTSESPYEDNFYVINSINEVFTVDTPGPGTSINEPTLSAVSQGTGIATMADGYLWRYEYTANPYEIGEVPSAWMNVNTFDSINTDDSEANIESFRRLGCRYVFIRADATDTMMTGDYRQIGLITNPRTTAVGNPLATAQEIAIGSVLTYSGELIYLQNNTVRNLAAGQTIQFDIIIRF